MISNRDLCRQANIAYVPSATTPAPVPKARARLIGPQGWYAIAFALVGIASGGVLTALRMIAQ